jgi:chromosome partitioning protein
MGLRVLFMDLDPQAHATFSLRKEAKNTITDILEKLINNQDITSNYTNVANNFWFIPSSIGLASLEHKLAPRDDKLEVLSSFLKRTTNDFDYCIIDCPPNLGLLTLNALKASTYALIPVNVCDFSLKGVEILKELLIMLKEFKGISPTPFYFLTQVDKRSCYALDFIEKVKNKLNQQLLKTVVRLNVHLKEACAVGKTIFEHKADSRGAEDFTALAEELERLTAKYLWAPLFLKGGNFNEAYVVGDFTNWRKEEQYKLNKISEDIWSINIPLQKGRYRYKFLTNDTWIADPHNKLTEDDSFGGKNSLLIVE